jgi:molybdopterin-binding protein
MLYLITDKFLLIRELRPRRLPVCCGFAGSFSLVTFIFFAIVSLEREQRVSLWKRRKNMKLSARNLLKGKVVKVLKGAVNSEVTIELSGGEKLVSVITNASAASLGLKKGKKAYAVIKASSIMIAVDE